MIVSNDWSLFKTLNGIVLSLSLKVSFFNGLMNNFPLLGVTCQYETTPLHSKLYRATGLGPNDGLYLYTAIMNCILYSVVETVTKPFCCSVCIKNQYHNSHKKFKLNKMVNFKLHSCADKISQIKRERGRVYENLFKSTLEKLLLQ